MTDLPPRLILFDGICAVCDAGMTWIMDHDPEGLFTYAPLQGATARAILDRHPELPEHLDSIVYVTQRPDGEHVTWHSGALLDIVAELPSAWHHLSVFRWVPAWLRDAAYRAFAAVRYRIFGTLEHCRLPSEGEAARMLP